MGEHVSLQKILQLFQSISGMNIAVYDHQFHHVQSQMYESNVCAMIHESPRCLDRCLASDLEALSQVAKTRRPLVYTCPFGFFEAIFPVLKEGTLVGYLFIGPAIRCAESVDAEVLGRIVESAPELDVDLLTTAIAGATHRTEEQLDSFCGLLAILGEYIENHTLLTSKNLTVGQLVKSYVKQHLSQKITLSRLSLALHCNTVTLTETFRREVGVTIMNYVQRERMARATYLLRSTDLSIAEIADLCGISQTEYFSKCFRTSFGLSPSEWRRRAKNAESIPEPIPLPENPDEEDFVCSPIVQD